MKAAAGQEMNIAPHIYTSICVLLNERTPGAEIPLPAPDALCVYTIFSGRTVSSNSSAVSSPRASTASFRVVPSARAFLAHLAAAS